MAAPVFESATDDESPGFGNTNVTLTKPSGVASGDLLIAQVSVNAAGATITPPSGFTSIGSVSYGSTHAFTEDVFWKVAGGSEPSTYTFSVSTTGDRSSGAMGRISGADGTTPINATASATYSLGSSADSPSVVTTINDVLVVVTLGGRATYTLPSGFTQQWFHSNSAQAQVTGATKTETTAGTIGPYTWTGLGFNFDYDLRTVAIAPPGSPPPPPSTGSGLVVMMEQQAMMAG